MNQSVEGVIRLRYPAVCSSCGSALERGARARWDSENKQAICLSCLQLAEGVIDRGSAGASAAREWRRRHERRERDVRARYGKLGGIVLALTDDPHSTNAWAYGANGERALGKVLDPLREEGIAVLHDRRIPGSRANIDHLVVSRAGVFVIDAKNYLGRVERRVRGGWFSSEDLLYVGGRNKTTLIIGMAKQSAAATTALGDAFGSVPVVQAVCFTAAEWPRFFPKPIRFGDVHVLWPDALMKLIRGEGALDQQHIAQIERQLAIRLPAA